MRRTPVSSAAGCRRLDAGEAAQPGSSRGDPDDEARPAAVERLLEADAAVVRLGHRAHDRQAEPGRAAVLAGAAVEALEHLLPLVERDPRPVVLDREHDPAVAAL